MSAYYNNEEYEKVISVCVCIGCGHRMRGLFPEGIKESLYR